MRPEARAELDDLQPVVHGGTAGPGVIDFSTGVSPLTPPAAILDAARTADLTRYPPADAAPLRAALAILHDQSPAAVVAAAGSVELIWALARAFGGPGRTGMVVTPAFGEYERALRVSESAVVTVPLSGPGFELTMKALEDGFSRTFIGASTRTCAAPIALVYLCRPSNPCLSACPPALIAAAARRWPATLFVVDEAYQPMFDGVPALAPTENMVILRSLTKLFALPGLRLGYMLASPRVARAVQAALPPWNVSAPAQAAGIVAAGLVPTVAPSIRRQLAELRDTLQAGLARWGSIAEAAGGPFLLYRVRHAERTRDRLLQRGILVRHAASLGLSDHLRIGVRSPPEQSRLVEAWPTAVQL